MPTSTAPLGAQLPSWARSVASHKPTLGHSCHRFETRESSLHHPYQLLPQHHDDCATADTKGRAGIHMPCVSISREPLTSLRILKDSVKALFTVPTPFACSSSTSCLKCCQEPRKAVVSCRQACPWRSEERETWRAHPGGLPPFFPPPLLVGQCHTAMDGGGEVAVLLAVPLHYRAQPMD